MKSGRSDALVTRQPWLVATLRPKRIDPTPVRRSVRRRTGSRPKNARARAPGEPEHRKPVPGCAPAALDHSERPGIHAAGCRDRASDPCVQLWAILGSNQ